MMKCSVIRAWVYWRRLACVLAGLAVLSLAKAVEVSGLYEVEIPVLSQAEDVRQQAFAEACKQVMVRVSGNPAVVAQAQTLLQQAARYVKRFSYRVPTENERKMLTKADDVPRFMLAVQFDGEALQRRMRELDLTVWNSNRPATLLWLGVEEGAQRRMLAESDQDELRQMIEQSALRRGIPLIFPLQDLEDRRHLSFGDIRGGYTPAILEASARYDAAIALAGTIVQDARGVWQAEWTVYRGNVSSGWLQQGGLAAVIASGIDGVADILASRYAESGLHQQRHYVLTMQIDGIQGAERYARVAHYLSKLTMVEALQPMTVSADRVSYRLTIRGEPHLLERAIALEKLIEPVEYSEMRDITSTATTQPAARPDLHYRLRQ